MELFKSDKKIEMLPLKILEAMYNYDWPGNIRELQNVLQRYITIGQIDFVDITEPQPVDINNAFVGLDQTDKGLRSILDKFEKQYLTKCLEQNRWHRGKTSSMLKLPAKTLYRKMKKHQLI
jgi:DNA-binding NtrC family response regulator